MDFLEKLVKGVGVVVIALIVVALLSIIGAYPPKWLVNYLRSANIVQRQGFPERQRTTKQSNKRSGCEQRTTEVKK